MTYSQTENLRAHILVVEDEHELLSVLCEMLRLLGYRVEEAHNGLEALAKLRTSECTIDLVISDWHMPELDGPSMIRVLRRELGFLGKICMLSGDVDCGAFAQDIGFDDILLKPFKRDQLLAMLERLVPMK